MELDQIVTVLREHELFCYQIALYILEQEDLAIVATESTLVGLAANHEFFAQSAQERRAWVKRTTIKQSLELREAEGLATVHRR